MQGVLDSIVNRIPAPFVGEAEARKNKNLKAFLFDAKYIPNRGVQCLIKIMSGSINLQFLRHLMSFHRQKRYDVFEIGVVQPKMNPTSILTIGQVGYFLSNMKSVSDAHIGDTFYEEKIQRD